MSETLPEPLIETLRFGALVAIFLTGVIASLAATAEAIAAIGTPDLPAHVGKALTLWAFTTSIFLLGSPQEK